MNAAFSSTAFSTDAFSQAAFSFGSAPPPPTPSGAFSIPGGKGDSGDETLRRAIMEGWERKKIELDDDDVQDALRVIMRFLTRRH